jgi:hypothetical protein
MKTITIVPYRPAPFAGMGQTPLPMAPPVPTRLPFIDSPLIQLATDATAAVASGMLGYAFGKHNSRWSTVFWVVSALTGAKGVVDLYRLQR